MDSTAIGWGIGWGSTILGFSGVIITALLARARHRSTVGDDLVRHILEIKRDINNGSACKAGTTEKCQDHTAKIAVIENELPHMRREIKSVDLNVGNLRSELRGWMSQNGNN